VATFRKRGKKWYAEIMVQGKRKGKSFDTKAAARKWADDEIELPTNNIYLYDMAEKYIETRVVNFKSAQDTTNTIRRLTQLLPDILASDLTKQMMSDWKNELGKTLSLSSLAAYKVMMSTMFNYCISEWGYMRVNPMKAISTPKGPDRERLPTDAESAEIIKQLGFKNRCRTNEWDYNKDIVAIIWLLALETAMRKIELLSICPGNTDLVNRVVRLKDTKNGDKRDVPLSTEAVRLIKLLPGGKPRINYDTASGVFTRACNKAGIQNLHFHDSRAYAIVKLSKVPGIDVLTLARIVGHRDVQSLMIYYREPAANVAKLLG
jgi:integrase|tara:strand:- start:7704 stop:8663 length:960 start_codon:yes stop_codon:yes gene_type:complete